MPQTTTLRAVGLYTYPDLLGEIPLGALSQADNVVIDRDGVVTPRRGFATYGGAFGTTGDTAKALLYYKARLLRHYDSTLDFDSDGNGTFISLATNILEPTPGVKIKFAEMNGNFYFTSTKGIKKISATAADNVISNGVTFAGGIEALDGNGYLNPTQGWFTQDSQVAYRIVWGIQDSNTNVVLGDPSQRIIVTNPQLSLGISDFNKLLLALDIVANAPPVVLTGSSTSYTYTGTIATSSNIITGISTTANLAIGMAVTDTTNPSYIPAGTIITQILSGTSVQINNILANNSTDSLFFTNNILTVGTTTNLSIGMTVADVTNPTYIPANTTITNVINSTQIAISNFPIADISSDNLSFGQILTYNNFASSFELSTDATSTELYTALQALATQLDESLGEHIYAGLSGTITAITPSVNITLTGNTNYTGTPSPIISNLSSVVGLVPRMSVSGYGIPADTTIVFIPPSAPINATGTVTVGSTSITAMSSTAGLSVGMTVTGDGIPAGTTIASVPPASLAGTITISQNALASNTAVALTFTNNTVTINNAVTETVANSPFIFSSPTTITSAGHGLISGDEITISGTNSTPVIDTTNPIVVTVLNSNQFSIPTQTSMAGNAGMWQQYPPSVLLTYLQDLSTLTDSATTQQLTYLQEIYQGLVNNLDVDAGISNFAKNYIVAKNYIGGAFTPATTSATTNIIFTIPSEVYLPPNGFYPTVNLTGTLTASSNVITGLSSTAGLIVGIPVVDVTNPTYIPTNTVITAINGPNSVTISNPATANSTDSINFLASTGWFYQVYRSDMATSIGQGLLSDQTADDELRLIDEASPTPQDLANGYIDFFDDVPESFRLNGPNLYTNAISGAGILQENSMPPYAQDLCLWTNFLFFANTSEKHELQINLLTADGLIGSTFTTTWNGIATTYNFAANAQQYTTITTPAASAFPSSGPAYYFDIYNAQNYTTYRVWFELGSATAPSSTGVTLIPVPILAADTANQVAAKLEYALLAASQDFGTIVAGSTITVENLNPGYTNSPNTYTPPSGLVITVTIPGSGERASTQTVGVATGPTPSQAIDTTARSFVRVVNQNSPGGVQATYLSGPTALPGQILFEAIETSLIPIYFTASSPAGANNYDPQLPSVGTSVVSDNNAHPNRLYWSKTQQPDAVPQVNYQDVGQRDYPILRILPLRDSLFILKEDGVYRLYGNDPSNFTVYLFDSSTKLLAQDTAVVLNNQVYMFSNQGVVTASDTGVSILSRPIEGSVVPINAYPNFTTTSFGVSYEADRAYLLWVQAEPTDTQPTICYRYNTVTNAWVDWPIAKTCGIVIPDTNILYLGAGDVNFVEKERKSYTRFDQTDRQYNQVIPVGGVQGDQLMLGSIFEAEPGDAIVQTQYLTIGDYNRLINKLDIDPGTSQDYTPYLAVPGDDLGSQIVLLAAALDADPNLHGGYSAAIAPYISPDTFENNQLAFNAIVAVLNVDIGTKFHSYTQSTGTIGWEVLVDEVNSQQNIITVDYALPFIAGPMIIYKAIASNVQWAPQHCGDPSMLKKFYEGTIMFQNMSFDSATLSYSSDLYTGPIAIPFVGEGADTWGGVPWGQTTWGGDGTSRPIRTYIPVPVQRCRFIQPSFDHSNAMRTYSIFGVSYTWEPISSRGYR
jgi:hypothetical protein